MSADLKQLENKLSSLGVSALVDYLGEEKSKKLNDLGIELLKVALRRCKLSNACRYVVFGIGDEFFGENRGF